MTNWDANDMIRLLETWQSGDISKIQDGGDYEKALKSIKAKGLIMPSKTDLYFPVSMSHDEKVDRILGKVTHSPRIVA